MSSTLYALLIGINDYLNVNKPNGCAVDAPAFASYFKENFSAMNPQIMTLTDAEATRQHVIHAFLTHLGKAKECDTM